MDRSTQRKIVPPPCVGHVSERVSVVSRTSDAKPVIAGGSRCTGADFGRDLFSGAVAENNGIAAAVQLEQRVHSNNCRF